MLLHHFLTGEPLDLRIQVLNCLLYCHMVVVQKIPFLLTESHPHRDHTQPALDSRPHVVSLSELYTAPERNVGQKMKY